MATIPLLPDFLDLLRLLNEERVEYLVIGGMAVNYHGYHRSTGDLDLWVSINPQNQDRLARRCGNSVFLQHLWLTGRC